MGMKKSGLNYTAYRLIVVHFAILPVQEQCLGAAHLGKQLWWSIACNLLQSILIGVMLWWSMACHFRQSILVGRVLWWLMACHSRQCILVGPIHHVPMRKIFRFLLLSSSCRPSSNISHTAGDFEGAYPQTIHKLSTNSIHEPQVMVKTTSLSLWMGVV